jgi:Flp pilus assembly protein TadG
VEFALCLPAIFLVLLALVQAGIVVRDQVLLTHAAREAVREAAVHDDKGAPRKAALARSGLDADRLKVEVSGQRQGSNRVAAKLRYRVPTTVAFVGFLIPDLTLEATAAMRRETR